MQTQSIKKPELLDEIPDIKEKKEIMKGLIAKCKESQERHLSAK